MSRRRDTGGAGGDAVVGEISYIPERGQGEGGGSRRGQGGTVTV